MPAWATRSTRLSRPGGASVPTSTSSRCRCSPGSPGWPDLRPERRAAFVEHGLRGYEFDVLSALRRGGEPFELTPGQLVRQTHVTSGTMTSRLDRLVARGLVVRRARPEDGRVVPGAAHRPGRDRVDAAFADAARREAPGCSGDGWPQPPTGRTTPGGDLLACRAGELVDSSPEQRLRGAELLSGAGRSPVGPRQRARADGGAISRRVRAAIDRRTARPIASEASGGQPRQALSRPPAAAIRGVLRVRAVPSALVLRPRCPASATGSACSPRPRWPPRWPTATRRRTTRSAACWSSGCCRRIVLGPLAGAFADRFDRRCTMVISDVLRFVLFLTIPLAHFVVDDHQTLAWLYVASFLIECVSLFWMPAKDASVPNLVRRDQIESANQLSLITTYGLTPVLGAALFSVLSLITNVLAPAPRLLPGPTGQPGALLQRRDLPGRRARSCCFIREISGRRAERADRRAARPAAR